MKANKMNHTANAVSVNDKTPLTLEHLDLIEDLGGFLAQDHGGRQPVERRLSADIAGSGLSQFVITAEEREAGEREVDEYDPTPLPVDPPKNAGELGFAVFDAARIGARADGGRCLFDESDDAPTIADLIDESLAELDADSATIAAEMSSDGWSPTEARHRGRLYGLRQLLGELEADEAADGKSGAPQAKEAEAVPQVKRDGSVPTANPAGDSIPDDLMNPGGLLGEVMEWILGESWIPQQEFALSAAIAILSVLTGQRIEEPTGERTNLYLMNLGESSSGKEGPASLAERLLDAIGLGDLIFSSAASGAGLLSVLRRVAVRLFAWDELGISLKALNDQRAGSWQREIISLLLSLFTRANATFRGKAYADADHDAAKAINQPHLVLLGSSTPATFYESLSAESVENGLLGRLLMFVGNPTAKANRDLERGPIPASIVEAARQWTERGSNAGDFGQLSPSPIRFRYTDDAASDLREWGERLESRKITLTGWRRAMLGRVEQIGKRLALIHAASIGPDSATIGVESVRWGSRLAEFLMQRLARHAADRIFENSHDKELSRVVEFIRSHAGGATRSELARAFRGIKSRDRDEILKHATDGGMIVLEVVKRGGKDVPIYLAPGGAA